MIIFLNLLWLVPVVVFRLVSRTHKSRRWRFTGISFGAIVSPAAMALYGLYFFSKYTAPLGILGLVLTTLHDSPSYDLAIRLHLVPPATLVAGTYRVYVEVLGGVIWATVYGVLGSLVDYLQGRKSKTVLRKDQR